MLLCVNPIFSISFLVRAHVILNTYSFRYFYFCNYMQLILNFIYVFQSPIVSPGQVDRSILFLNNMSWPRHYLFHFLNFYFVYNLKSSLLGALLNLLSLFLCWNIISAKFHCFSIYIFVFISLNMMLKDFFIMYLFSNISGFHFLIHLDLGSWAPVILKVFN